MIVTLRQDRICDTQFRNGLSAAHCAWRLTCCFVLIIGGRTRGQFRIRFAFREHRLGRAAPTAPSETSIGGEAGPRYPAIDRGRPVIVARYWHRVLACRRTGYPRFGDPSPYARSWAIPERGPPKARVLIESLETCLPCQVMPADLRLACTMVYRS